MGHLLKLRQHEQIALDVRRGQFIALKEQNKRLIALVREAIGFADLTTRPDDACVHEAAAAIEDWRRRARAEVG